MDKPAVVSTLVSVLSLAVSVFVLWRQHQAAGRAHFTAEWEAPDSLVYLNHGPGAARDVQVHLHSPVEDRKEDVPYIGAFQSMRIWVIQAWGAAPPGPLVLSWRDSRFRRQAVEISLPQPPQPPRPTAANRDALEKAVRSIAKQEAEQEVQHFAKSQRWHGR